MNPKIEQLLVEISQLEEERINREAALPAHSLRPHQLMAIEEVEEAIYRKQKELKALRDAENQGVQD